MSISHLIVFLFLLVPMVSPFATINKYPSYGLQPPLQLPASFDLGNDVKLTLSPTGSYSISTSVQCIQSPCPESGGSGHWLMNIDTNQITFYQIIDTNWIVQQTWKMYGKGDQSNLNEDTIYAMLLFHSGLHSDQYPINKMLYVWNRIHPHSS